MTGWQCGACSTYNPDERELCDICSTDRLAVPQVHVPVRSRWPARLGALVLVAALPAAAWLWGTWAQGDRSAGRPRPGLTVSGPVGLVDVGRVSAHPAAVAVAQVLDTYFSGINDKDFVRATSVLDPAGMLNPNDPAQVSQLAHDEATRAVGTIAVTGIAADPAIADALTVSATFRSTQSPGYGPRERPNETCTLWTVVYTFTKAPAGGYRILRGTGPSAPCG